MVHLVIVHVAPQPFEPGVGQHHPAGDFALTLVAVAVPGLFVDIQYRLRAACRAFNRRDGVVVGQCPPAEYQREHRERRQHGVRKWQTEPCRHCPEVHTADDSERQHIFDKPAGTTKTGRGPQIIQ